MPTVAAKIWLGCLVIVLLGAITLVLTYRGLVQVQKEMRHLTDVHEPIKSAAQEMEINLKGTAMGTLAYLSAPNPAFEALVADNEADFERFHAEYARLATTEAEKQLGETVGKSYAEFKKQGRELKARRDRQSVTFTEVLANLEATDRLFDQQLPVALGRPTQDNLIKREAIFKVDEGIDAIRMRAAIYRWSRASESRKVIDQKIVECQEAFDQLRALEWNTREQKQAVSDAEQPFAAAMVKVQEVLNDEDAIQAGIAQFIELRLKMDALLDEDIQPIAATSVRQPRERVDAHVAEMAVHIIWLMLLFLATAGVVSLVLTRAIIRPLRSLAQGTAAVSAGDLSVQLQPVSRDEFSKLAGDFNRMVTNLHDTMVSKELLEKSEEQLQKTVQALQDEMAHRVHKEEERTQLQASLRRAEMLSAMGTLVAGVAHQVRNPLFGMSSVLDAMEARLGNREEYRRYIEVLRSEACRVAALMHELMEYGGASSGEQSPVALTEIIHEVMSVCQNLATKAQVTIEARLDAAMPEVMMDRPRVHRAFENLLENAIQYSPPRSRILISATRLEDAGREWIEVRIEDCGPGFKQQDLPLLFEPFFTRRPGGTGLGLALVERIVKTHGGQVIAANRPVGGAVMTVRLPVHSTSDTHVSHVNGNGVSKAMA